MKAKRARILIQHNLHNALPAEVLVHEIPVIRVLRGANKVTFLEEIATLPETVIPRAEFLRLKQQYQSQRDGEGTNPVDAAFPDGSRDLEIILRDGLDAFDRHAAGEPEVIVDEDEPEEEKIEEEVLTSDDDAPEPLDRAAIMAQLTEKGIPFSVNTPTQRLFAKLPVVDTE